MESVLPALGLTPSVSGVLTGMKYATYLGKKSYDVVKTITGGSTGTRELKSGIVRKGLTGSGVAPLVGSNKVVVGSAKNLPQNKPMQPTPPRTPSVKKRKSKSDSGSTRKAKKAKKASKPNKKAIRKLNALIKGVSEGKYSGKMKKSAKEVSMTKFSHLGYVTTATLIGTVADPTCCYIYHSTYDVNMIARAIIAALLRKLFKKAGIDVVNENNELSFEEYTNSTGFMFQYRDVDPTDQNVQSYSLIIQNNTTFKTLLDTICTYAGSPDTPYKRIIDYMLVPDQGKRVPYSMSLQVQDKWINPNEVVEVAWRTHTHMALQNEKIVLYCKSLLTVQNRTKGSAASASDYSDQRVDNQPLQGKLYEFSNGDPRLKSTQHVGSGLPNNEYDFLVNTGAATTVRAFGSVVFPADYMDSPPGGKYWKNCKKVDNVVVQPGDIKKTSINVKYDMNLPDLLTKFRIASQQFIVGDQSYTGLKSHKSQILALEEILRTPQDNFITVQYEVQNFCGAYAYSKKSKSYFRTQHFEGTQNQWVPPPPPT